MDIGSYNDDDDDNEVPEQQTEHRIVLFVIPTTFSVSNTNLSITKKTEKINENHKPSTFYEVAFNIAWL